MPGTEPADPRERFASRAIRDRNPFSACGRTVSYLMKVPNLARLPFGQLSRLIVGQINRGHYFFIVDEAAAICGYCGWTQASHEQAEAWLTLNAGSGSGHTENGPVCVINLWQASTPKTNAIIIGALRTQIHTSTEMIVAKRFYPDGTIRPVRIPISKRQLRPPQPDADI